ncbi:MAG: ParB/RepB/Spo0J family partition protein [Gammaproteobacteria bacterium]|nr:ParB/RepB/Spo0J family partition protein [Gammaproteobacteria bacterium]
MNAKRTGLGRGLDALLGEAGTPARPAPAEPREGLKQLPVELLQRGEYQPRQDMDAAALEDLARSIRAQGLVQPIVVRPLPTPSAAGETRYEIIAGERRWRAAQMAGLATVPAVVRQIPDSAVIAQALIENIQREDLNPLEEAQAVQRLINEFQLTHQDAAEAIGRSRASVSNLLRLLELGEQARSLLRAGAIEMGHARALLGLADLRMQAEVASVVAKKSLSVRETEALVRRMQAGGGKSPPGGAQSRRGDPDVQRLEHELTDRLGARVEIRQGAKGRGRLVINYNSLDELEGIIGHIN